MGLISNMRSWWPQSDNRLTSLFGGIPVTYDGFDDSQVDDILALPPVQSCIGIIARSISQVQLGVKVKQDRSWVEPTSGALADLHELIGSLVNSDETASQFWDQITRDVLSTQTGYAQILRNGRGEVWSLRRLDPSWVKTSRNDAGQKTWKVSVPGREPKTYTLDDPSRPPVLSIEYKSPIFGCPAFWNFAIAAYRVGAHYYRNGARQQGMLQTSQAPTSEESNALRASWRALTAEGAGPVVMGKDIEWTALGSTLEEAQLGHFLNWITETVAALFGVPPSRLGLPQRTSYASLEADAKSLVSQAVTPFLTALTQGLKRDLLSTAQFRTVRIHVDTSPLIPVDSTTQSRTLSALYLAGLLSRDEARAAMGYDPAPGDDMYVSPVNVAPLLEAALHPKAEKESVQ